MKRRLKFVCIIFTMVFIMAFSAFYFLDWIYDISGDLRLYLWQSSALAGFFALIALIPPSKKMGVQPLYHEDVSKDDVFICTCSKKCMYQQLVEDTTND